MIQNSLNFEKFKGFFEGIFFLSLRISISDGGVKFFIALLVELLDDFQQLPHLQKFF